MVRTLSDLSRRLAAHMRELRLAQGLRIPELAARSGVSGAMISLIERCEASPSVLVLEKLAAGLGTTPHALLAAASEPSADEGRAEEEPICPPLPPGSHGSGPSGPLAPADRQGRPGPSL